MFLTRVPEPLVQLMKLHGQLIYDITYSVLQSPSATHDCTRTTLQKLKKQSKQNSEPLTQEQVISILFCELKKIHKKKRKLLSPSEQLMMDSTLDAGGRLSLLSSYLAKLDLEDQLILTLQEKYSFSIDQISDCLEISTGTILARKSLALESLDCWLWGLS